MWQRFTERARRAVFYAQEEAGRLGENFVSTEHLLLGLLREGDHVAARMLLKMGCSPGRIRQDLERQMPHSNRGQGKDMQLTPRGKRVIDLAYDEAKMLKNNYIGTEHVLLGLIREKEGLAGKVLSNAGAALEPAREILQELQRHPSPSPVQGPTEMLLQEAFDEKREMLEILEHSISEQHASGAEGPQRGDLGIAQGPTNGGQLVLAVSEEAYIELREVVAIKDDYAYYELVQAGKVFPALPTRAKLLNKSDSGGYLVRLMDGELANKTGWLAPEQFERTGPDERPFPPLPEALPATESPSSTEE